ncbi:MAG: tetratricopeptide repeat protein [Fimbriiglobus sp.]
MSRKWLVILLLTCAITPFMMGDDAAFRAAQDAFRKEDYKTARDKATEATKAEPKRIEAHLLLGLACGQLREHQAAINAYTDALKLNDKLASAYDYRGNAKLKLGQFAEAVKDFDEVLKLNPEFAPKHWRRGIALYYVEKYAEGAKQFETHKKDNPEDVENAAWHYLCNAKVIGAAKAREQLISVTKDPRVPMPEIQQLYAGKMKPEEVLAAAEKQKADSELGIEARFYANLYVGLYYISENDTEKGKTHLTTAAEKYKIGHYMWDIAKVHVELLKAKK